MGCCGWLELFRCHKKEHGSDARSSFVNGVHELLHTFKTGTSERDSLKYAKNGKSVVPLSGYKPSHEVEEVKVNENNQVLHRSSLTLSSRSNSEAICEDLTREIPVKMTNHAGCSEDFDGNKMVNEYARVRLIGTGSYGKVVLYQNRLDGKLYAIKVLRRSRLRKIRVAPSQTALNDVMREVDIMKKLHHPRIVNLIEVIDDPDSDRLYMVLEYVEGGQIFDGPGPIGGIGEMRAWLYFRDAVEGLVYLHERNVVHGDIKPENLLVTSEGRIKIADFSISQMLKNGNDLVQRSPGTPVFTAPECCTGSPYDGKTADTWALGVTLYCMTFGCYPFIGANLQDIYDKIVHVPLHVPDKSMNPNLVDLLSGLFCKDPKSRMSLKEVMEHPWFVEAFGHNC